MAEISCGSVTLNSFSRDCSPNMGGVKKVWMILKSDINAVAADGAISSISASGNFYQFPFRKGAASFTSNLQKDDTAGSYYWETDLVMNFQRMETRKRIAVMALTQAESAAIVLDNNDKYWFLGYDEYLSATAGTGETGTAKTDANQYTVTLQDSSLELPYEIPTSVIDGLNLPEVPAN